MEENGKVPSTQFSQRLMNAGNSIKTCRSGDESRRTGSTMEQTEIDGRVLSKCALKPGPLHLNSVISDPGPRSRYPGDLAKDMEQFSFEGNSSGPFCRIFFQLPALLGAPRLLCLSVIAV